MTGSTLVVVTPAGRALGEQIIAEGHQAQRRPIGSVVCRKRHTCCLCWRPIGVGEVAMPLSGGRWRAHPEHFDGDILDIRTLRDALGWGQ